MTRNTEPTLPRYIGIAGAKRSGKDTLAALLSGSLCLPVDSFAGPMRQFVALMAGMGTSANALQTLEVHKETQIPWLGNTTPRHMLQTLGTEWGRRMIHPDLWTAALFARFEGGIVSDVRFPNESAAIRARGGVVLRIKRPALCPVDTHASETPLPTGCVDIELVNDGSPADLERAALKALEALCAARRLV